MQMSEYVERIEYHLGLHDPDSIDAELVQTERAVTAAFQELKVYMRTSTDKTVPYSTRIDLLTNNILTRKVLSVYPSQPRIGLTMSSIDSGNVFQVAAAVNVYSAIGQTSSLNIDPIVTEMAMAQVRNTLSTDFQWKYDISNQCVYCTHRDPRPAFVTIHYVPEFQDVSEVTNNVWIDYILRLGQAFAKQRLGRIKTQYAVKDSNVDNDGEILLNEATSEINDIREKLQAKKTRLVVLN